MPREKDGHTQRGIRAPDAIWAELDNLAARTGRSATQEVIHAIERHLARPPVVTTETPEMEPASVKKPAKARAKPGPRKHTSKGA